MPAAFEYVPLVRTLGNPGMGWIAICPIDDFTSIKVPVGPFTSPGDSVTISTAHTFTTGREPIKMPVPLNGSELDDESFGDNSAGTKQTAKTFVPGLDPAIVEFMEKIINEPVIVFIKDGTCDTNQVWQIGCECNPAKVGFKMNSGQKGNGEKGFALEIMAACSLHAYEGLLPFRS